MGDYSYDYDVYSTELAEDLGLDHQEVLNLIEKYKDDFEEIGDLEPEYDYGYDFDKDEPIYNYEKVMEYQLEGVHQKLLIMLAPNTEKALKLKMDLIHGRIAWD